MLFWFQTFFINLRNLFLNSMKISMASEHFLFLVCYVFLASSSLGSLLFMFGDKLCKVQIYTGAYSISIWHFQIGVIKIEVRLELFLRLWHFFFLTLIFWYFIMFFFPLFSIFKHINLCYVASLIWLRISKDFAFKHHSLYFSLLTL